MIFEYDSEKAIFNELYCSLQMLQFSLNLFDKRHVFWEAKIRLHQFCFVISPLPLNSICMVKKQHSFLRLEATPCFLLT